MKRRRLNLAALRSPWVFLPVLLAVGLLVCAVAALSSYVQEVSWRGTLRSYLPSDAHDVKFGGSTDFLRVEGVGVFASSPAALDKLVSSGGFTDITDDGAPDDAMLAELDELGRRHVGQSLDSLGKVRVYQKILREVSDIFEDIVVVRAESQGKAVLYYRYQQ